MNSTDRVTPTAALRFCYALLERFCFNRVRVVRDASVPREGPILFLGLHRNGAIDGAPYVKATPRAAFLVSAQLHRSRLGRWLFRGIAVARRKDRERGIETDNALARERCIERLIAGKSLFIMPEGTSSLGPRHLPFRPGAAAIAGEALRRGAALVLVPLAIHYECASEWQSRVEVVMGKPCKLSREEAVRPGAISASITQALESVGVNVASAEDLELIERLAFAATLHSTRSYSECLKHFERHTSSNLRSCYVTLQRVARELGAWHYQGIPLIPPGTVLPSVLKWLALAPFMLAAVVANAPAVLAAYFASRKLPDDTNVIAFWRAAVGVPAALVWGVAVTSALLARHHAGIAALYLGLSALAIRAVRSFRQLSVAVHNGLIAAGVRAPLKVLAVELQQSLDGVYG